MENPLSWNACHAWHFINITFGTEPEMKSAPKCKYLQSDIYRGQQKYLNTRRVVVLIPLVHSLNHLITMCNYATIICA